MGRRSSETSPELRGAIVALHFKGLSNGAVAQCTGVSKVTVARWIKRYKATGSTMDQPRSGRPRCRSKKQQQQQQRDLPRTGSEEVPFTPKTVGLLLLPSVRMEVNSEDLSDCEMEARMEFALEYSDRPSKFWKSVVFCSEMTFRPNCAVKDSASDESDDCRVSLFGWMHSTGVGEMAGVEGGITEEEYVRLLDEVLLPSVKARLFPEPAAFYLLQDGSRSTDAVRSWFGSHPEITVVRRPPKTPDLSPVENLWGSAARSLGGTVLRSGRDLVEGLRSAWEDLRGKGGRDVAARVVASMPYRLNRVIDAGGAYPDY